MKKILIFLMITICLFFSGHIGNILFNGGPSFSELPLLFWFLLFTFYYFCVTITYVIISLPRLFMLFLFHSIEYINKNKYSEKENKIPNDYVMD
jgi:hypothetical protein